jgi:hypothetical protein
MKQKLIPFLTLFFGFQLFVACCSEETFEVTITGFDSKAYIVVDNQFVAVEEATPINKEDLLVSTQFVEDQVLISDVRYQKKKSDVEVAQAAISCPDPVFINTNELLSVKVEVIDVDNGNTRIDVTDQVVVVGTNESVEEFLLERPWSRDFQVEFSGDTSNIPNRIRFAVEGTLDDGTVVNSEIGIINFN